MNTISVIGTRAKSKLAIVGWIIQKLKKSEISHISFSFYSQNLDSFGYYEAKGKGVNFCGEKAFNHHNQIVYQVDFRVSDAQFYAFIKRAFELAGTKYAFLQTGWMALVLLFGAKKRFTDGINCSELIIRFSDIIGITFSDDADLSNPDSVMKEIMGAKNDIPNLTA